MILDIIHSEKNLLIVKQILLALQLCNREELERAVVEFKKDFAHVDVDLLMGLSEKLIAGQIDGSSLMIRKLPLFERAGELEEIPYGDFYATLGEEIRFSYGDTSDAYDEDYLTSYEIYEREYPNMTKFGTWEIWMKDIRPGQTPKNNEVVRIFYEANEALIAKLAKHQIANKQ
jgi:hypothetical protein